MEDSAVKKLSHQIFLAGLKDDLRANEAVKKIAAWTGVEYAPSTAEQLIRYCLETYKWDPEKTAAMDVIDVAALLPTADALTPITKEAFAALSFLADRSPVCLSLEDIADGAKISKPTAQKAIIELEKVGYVSRPNGPNKGATATKAGIELSTKLCIKL